MSIVRLAACFDADQSRANFSQLKEFGRPDVSIGQDKIDIGQLFRGQWAADENHIGKAIFLFEFSPHGVNYKGIKDIY